MTIGSITRTAALAACCASPAAGQQPAPAPPPPAYTFREVMIPVRDGVHLQTAILAPVGVTKPLPILFRRTPYGVPEKTPAQMPASFKELAQDGYIFVIQNLRGRFARDCRWPRRFRLEGDRWRPLVPGHWAQARSSWRRAACLPGECL